MYYFLNDHLGTPQKIVDSAGKVVWEAAYLAFGEAQILTGDIVNNFRFPGQYFDAETGLQKVQKSEESLSKFFRLQEMRRPALRRLENMRDWLGNMVSVSATKDS